MQPIAIHRATSTDTPALERLAGLDSARTPSGDVLVASVGREPAAAIELATGRTVADPFRPTADVVELLRMRAQRLGRESTASSRRLRLRRTASAHA